MPDEADGRAEGPRGDRARVGDPTLDAVLAGRGLRGSARASRSWSALGSGKSTLLGAIAGLAPPDERAHHAGGRDVVRRRERRINVAPQRRRVAIVFQSLALFPHMTARERRLRNGARARSSRAARSRRRLLERLRVAHLAERRPPTFSGGEAQRVAIARALATEPARRLARRAVQRARPGPPARLAAEVREILRQLRDPGPPRDPPTRGGARPGRPPDDARSWAHRRPESQSRTSRRRPLGSKLLADRRIPILPTLRPSRDSPLLSSPGGSAAWRLFLSPSRTVTVIYQFSSSGAWGANSTTRARLRARRSRRPR